MASSKVAIVIPAFNEAASIDRVVTELINIVGTETHVVVVNDCSTDDTGNIALQSGAHVVNLANNHGYAQAINQGLAYASSELDVEYLVTMDADGQHDPKSVELLINLLLNENVDLVVGKRYRVARFSEWLYCVYFKIFFKVADPLCGLKGYRKSTYLEYGTFETYDSIGTEILTRSLLSGKEIRQIAVNIRPRNDAPRFGSGWSVNKRIFLSLINTMILTYKLNLQNRKV